MALVPVNHAGRATSTMPPSQTGPKGNAKANEASKKAQKAPLKQKAKPTESGESEEEDDEEEEQLQLNIDNFGRPHGVEGLLDYNFRSIHDALRIGDEKSYVDLVADCEAAFTAREIENAEYSTGTTFFLPATTEPRCLLERMARAVFDFHTRDVKEYDPSKSGAEWWTLVLDAGETNDDVSFHWDRDYGLEDEYRVNLHPHIGTVTYLSTIGGPTIVLDKVSPVQTGSDDCGAGDIAKGYLSRPAMGKHISFDGRLLHGAPGDLATVFADSESASDKDTTVGDKRKRSDEKSSNGRRITFLVNVWLNHKPIESDLLPDEDLAKFISSEKASVKFAFDEAEEKQTPDEDVRLISVDDELKAGSAVAVTTLDLSFVEASRQMSLKLPIPVKALQEAVRKTPKLSSFEIQFSTSDAHKAQLVAGDEVEEEDEDEDEDVEDDDDDEEEEEEEEDDDDEEEE